MARKTADPRKNLKNTAGDLEKVRAIVAQSKTLLRNNWLSWSPSELSLLLVGLSKAALERMEYLKNHPEAGFEEMTALVEMMNAAGREVMKRGGMGRFLKEFGSGHKRPR